MRLAVLQMSDEPQIRSTAIMLRHAGYEVKTCGLRLREYLQRIGCDTVLSTLHMEALGYDKVDPSITEAYPKDVDKCDLFAEIKVRNIPKITAAWPHLANKMLWWRVNGAQPEICPKGGDEVNLPCPVATACLWYGTDRYRWGKGDQAMSVHEHGANKAVTLEELKAAAKSIRYHDTESTAYVFWPPYASHAEYDSIDRSSLTTYREPYCLCHSVRAWGYGSIISECKDLGVSLYGNNSPHGQVSHRQVPGIVANALALIHLKSVDCPGWALYEAMLGGCPAVVGRLLNSRMLAYDLLEENNTCLEFGAPATLEYGRGDPDLPRCLSDIRGAITALKDPATNRRIGEAGRQRLNRLMWNPGRDGDSFIAFMKKWYK